MQTIDVRSCFTSEEFAVVNSLVEKRYIKEGHITSFAIRPDKYFCARNSSGDILGVVAVMMSSGRPDFVFPTEDIFDFSLKDVFPGIQMNEVVEIGRLVTFQSNPLITMALMIFLHDYLMASGYRMVIASMKPFLVDHVEKTLRLRLQRHDVAVVDQRVPHEHAGYFLHDPRPVVITVDLQTTLPDIMRLKKKLGVKRVLEFSAAS